MRIKIVLLAALAVSLTGCADTTYPGAWRDSGPAFWEIAKTLAQEGITGCGELYYKLADGRENPGDALVYCTADGKHWEAYLVFYRTGSVLNVQEDQVPPYTQPLGAPPAGRG